VSNVELDPQALLTIGTHIVKNVVVFIMMSGERLCPWVSCYYNRHKVPWI